MRDTLLMALATLILTGIAFAGQNPSGQIRSLDGPAETLDLVDLVASSSDGSWIVAETTPLTAAVALRRSEVTWEPPTGAQRSCGSGVGAATQTPGDDCVDCQIGCFRKFEECRQACGPIWDLWEYIGCFDACVAEQVRCERSCEAPCS